MYSERELIRLADHKNRLRHRIGRHRAQCIEATSRVARPMVRWDRTLIVWRRFSPLAKLAAVPLGIVIARTLSRRLRILRSLVRWGPLVAGAARVISLAVQSRSAENDSTAAENSEPSPDELHPMPLNAAH